ncbi:MAG: DUF1080 domain-containing protein [Planctomycetota bacterium]|nr:DUF1080 domain-containing protein [Planctomycetota bacterium]
MQTFSFPIFIGLLISTVANGQLPSGWKAHDLKRPAPRVVTPTALSQPGKAPSDAIILFDGNDLSQWKSNQGKAAKWKIVEGAMESVAGSGPVITRKEFSDCQLHVEFASPKNVKGKGQGRGNSGVFLMGDIEVQVLDSFDNATYADGSAGAIYGQYPPLVNASRKPGEWQAYDIIFRAPRFSKDGKLIQAARLTVLHNGVLIQDSSEIYGPTAWIQHRNYTKGKTKGPISLQDHGNPVRYRNIWVRSLAKNRQQPPKRSEQTRIQISEAEAKKLAGQYGNIRVTNRGNQLFLNFFGAALEMVPQSKSQFLFTKSAGKAIFQVDAEGNGTDLELILDAAGTRKGKKK